MQESNIMELVVKTVSLANKKFNLNLSVPEVEFFTHGKEAGWAHYTEHKVKFNLTLASQYPDEFHNTVIHEISHLVTYAIYGNSVQAHGPQFKSIDKDLGGLGTTYYTYDVLKTKPKRTITRYVCKCNCMEHKVTKRAAQGDYVCKLCKSNLIFTGEIIKIKP